MGSDVGIHANFLQSAYAASKFAIHGLSQVMRWELQGFGIRVAVIDPGWYATEFADSIVSTFSQGDAAVHYEALIRAWKEGVARVEGPNEDPQEVADLALRLIEMPEPPLINPVGWNPIRMAGIRVPESDEEYERTLFDYYDLAAFREPVAGGTKDA